MFHEDKSCAINFQMGSRLFLHIFMVYFAFYGYVKYNTHKVSTSFKEFEGNKLSLFEPSFYLHYFVQNTLLTSGYIFNYHERLRKCRRVKLYSRKMKFICLRSNVISRFQIIIDNNMTALEIITLQR